MQSHINLILYERTGQIIVKISDIVLLVFMNFGQLITAQTVTLISLLLPSNHRKGRSAPKPRKPWSPSTCPTVNVWVSASTGPTTAACVRTDGAARHAAHALYLWPLSARTASVSRGRLCSSSRVNAAMTAATSMKWLSLHSTGCMEIHTSSQTSTEDDDFLFLILIRWGQLSWWRKTLQD